MIDFKKDIDELLTKLCLNEKIIYNTNGETTNETYNKEKFEMLRLLFKEKPGIFLERYHKYINDRSDLSYFTELDKTDPIIKHYIDKIVHNIENKELIVRNRRYSKLEQLLSDGQYFSHEQMKVRQPVLYQKYVGNFLAVGEEDQLMEREFSNFSGFLLTNMLHREDKFRRKCAEAISDDLEDMSESSESEESEVDEAGDAIIMQSSSKEKRYQKFLEIMKRFFMEGKDDFSYEDVDNNSDFDNQEQIVQSMEDRYFDEEVACDDNLVDDKITDDGFIEYKDRSQLGTSFDT